APRSPHGIGRNSERHQGGAKVEILQERRGKFIGWNIRRGSKLLAFSKTCKVISPRNHVSRAIEAPLQKVESRGAVVVMMEIVLAGPQQLDGHADLFGNGSGFEHVVVGQAPAEPAA